MPKNENIMDIIAKGATAYIKTKTKMKQDELKMGSALMLKQIEQRMDPAFQMQKMMAEQYRGQMGGAGRRPLEMDTQRFITTPRVRYKGGRFERGVPETRGIYNYLLRKKREQPKKFDKEDEEMLRSTGQKLGLEVKPEAEITPTQRRKEEIQKGEALTVLKQGYYVDTEKGVKYAYDLTNRGEAEAYLMEKYDIDINDPDIQEALNEYKPVEEKITPARKGFLGIGKREYPTREKYGYTYEQREDGKWHRIGE